MVDGDLVVRLIELPGLEQLTAAHSTATTKFSNETRQLVIVCITLPDGRVGWGECAALNEATYSAESAAGAFELLASHNPEPAQGPMAAAAVEMARLDLQLQGEGRSLFEHLADLSSATGPAGPTPRMAVPAGAAVGLGTADQTLQRVAKLRTLGSNRVKLKIGPAFDPSTVAAVLALDPTLEVQVDGNASLDLEHFDALLALDDLGVSAIEQPFAVDDLSSAARLVAECRSAQVVADEAVTSSADAQRLADAGALSGLSIKAPRVGGLTAAVQLHDWCVANDIAASAGGMLECGLGRHALVALAALPGFTITGDVSPARRWLAADPWPDIATIESSAMVPTNIGIAPPPDVNALDEFTIRTATRPV